MIAVVLRPSLLGLLGATLGISPLERELHLDVPVDLVVSLEDDIVVKLGVGHMRLDPPLLDSFTLLLMVGRPLHEELFRAEAQDEITVSCEAIKCFSILLNLATFSQDLLVELFKFLVLLSLLYLELLLLLLFHLLHLLIFRDVLVQVSLIVFELLARLDQ